MKKVLSVLLILVLFIPLFIKAEEKEVNMYLFYGEECPHCHALLEFLEPYIENHENVKLYTGFSFTTKSRAIRVFI